MSDCLLESPSGAMGATADVCLAEGGKPSFDLPNPRNRGPSEMRMETRMASQLGIDRGGLVLVLRVKRIASY